MAVVFSSITDSINLLAAFPMCHYACFNKTLFWSVQPYRLPGKM